MSILGAEDKKSAGDVSTVTVAVNNDPGPILALVGPAYACIAAGLPSVGQSVNQVFTPNFLSEASLSLSHLLKERPVVHGTGAHLLCDVLLKLLKIRKVAQMTELTINEIMYLYCRGELLAFVMNPIRAREIYENFHARLLGQFIPSRQISQLRAERYKGVVGRGIPY